MIYFFSAEVIYSPHIAITSAAASAASAASVHIVPLLLTSTRSKMCTPGDNSLTDTGENDRTLVATTHMLAHQDRAVCLSISLSLSVYLPLCVSACVFAGTAGRWC